MTVLGAFAGLPLLATDGRSPGLPPLYEWNGTSLGCPSRLLIYHGSQSAAEAIVARCVAEIERLERIFALYREDSEIARLNRDGQLFAPSHDLLAVLSLSQHLSALSKGGFDVTVQPLWDLYAAHFFATPSPAPEGPEPRAIAGALKLVDWKGVDISARQVALARPDMRLTLNGIAQGHVTDRIIEILRDHGFDRVLADLGRSEIYAIGRHPDGRPWRIGLADPRRPEQFALTRDLTDCSVCTSGGYGTKFEASGRFHHLFEPATGASANHFIAVSVFAPNAVLADALSTALYVTPPDRGSRLLAHFPRVTALVTLPDGKTHQLVGSEL
jgi:thiamine biosynthesis lipoprotein